jgi:ubiquitin carboxyl-terminal hydrolase 7
MGWREGQNFKMYEEIKHNMIEPIKGKQTLAQSEIQDGDIITIQKVYPEKEMGLFVSPDRLYDAREFYDNLLHRIRVKFAPRYGDDGKEFELDLQKRMTYSQLCQKVAAFLGPEVDPTHLRFSPVNASNGRAKIPIRHTTTSNLGQILTPGYNNYGSTINQRTDALYYEILEVSMSELETRKTLKVTWLAEGIVKEVRESNNIRQTKANNVLGAF